MNSIWILWGFFLKRNEMRWDEIGGWDEMRWDEMKWDETKYGGYKEMRWNEIRWDEMK